jgi:hypothetical protein
MEEKWKGARYSRWYQKIFFGEENLRKAHVEYTEHYHMERNHQGKNNSLLFPDPKLMANKGKIKCQAD